MLQWSRENELCDRLRAGFDNVIVHKGERRSQSVLNPLNKEHHTIFHLRKTMGHVLVTQNLDSWWDYLENFMIYYVSQQGHTEMK